MPVRRARPVWLICMRWCAGGEPGFPGQRVHGGRDGGDDHRQRLCVRRDGGVRDGRGDQGDGALRHASDAVAPAQAAGTHNVYVTTHAGTSATVNADRYSYVAPTVTGVSPDAGSTAGSFSADARRPDHSSARALAVRRSATRPRLRRSATTGLAPYLDLAQHPTAIAKTSGVHQLTLAFVTARGAGQCTPSWGGDAADPATGAKAYERSAVAALRASGHAPIVSFGGAHGTDLASACSTAAALRHAYARVIAAYHPSRIDFDIEGAALDQTAAITRRSQAIAALQADARRDHHTLAVSLTLPALPTGLPADALAILRSAATYHVTLSTINPTTTHHDNRRPHPGRRLDLQTVTDPVISPASTWCWLQRRPPASRFSYWSLTRGRR